MLKLEKVIFDRTNGEVNVKFTHPECLEIFDINATKANAIKKLGLIDGFNDYEMLKEAKKGFIMKNAHYSLKEALPHLEIVSSNSKNGVAKKLIELYNI